MDPTQLFSNLGEDDLGVEALAGLTADAGKVEG